MILSSIKHQESVVLVPRRLEEVETFRKALLEQELIVTEWPLVQKGAVALVTKFGLVPEILKMSKSAVVGGSFSLTLGVHDFWEPLQNGVATCIGPYSRGQRETVCTLVREGVLTQLQTTAGFADRNKADIRMVKSFLERERLKITESYQKLVEFLKDLLKAQG
jgi:3-deoxy-D-manno-octulosonic-acid transferase